MVFSLLVHLYRSRALHGWTLLYASSVPPSSEKVVTVEMRVTTICSIIIRNVREAGAVSMPSRKDCNFHKQAQISATSVSTF